MKLLKQLTNNIQKNTRVVLQRSVNRALSKTNTRLKRTVTQGLKLKSKDISRRSKIFKASNSKLNGAVSFGTKWGISLSKFKFKTRVVKVNKRKYKEVVVNIGTGKLVDKNNFTNNAKTTILHRVGKSRLPIKKSMYSLLPYVQSQKTSLQKYLKEEFKIETKKQIKYLTRR